MNGMPCRRSSESRNPPNCGQRISPWEAPLTPSPILTVLSSLRKNGVRYLLMGGQACVVYGGAEFIVYGRLLAPSTSRSAHGRRGHRVSRANPTPSPWRPRAVPPLRAASPREDAAPQGRVGEPRELARLAGSRRAARDGIRRGRTPRLSRVRHPLLRFRPRGLHDVPHGIRRGGPAEPGPAGRGHGWPALPAASCKGRGVCPSCNGRHMAQTAAHLVDTSFRRCPCDSG